MVTPTGQAVLDAIQIFFTFMYAGNLSAGEASRPLGIGYAGTGYYYERDTSTNEVTTRTAKYRYISNDIDSLVYPGLVYDTDADYDLNITLIEGKDVYPITNDGLGIQFTTTDGWRVLVDGTQAGFSYWVIHDDIALIYGNRMPTYNYNPTTGTFTGEPPHVGTSNQNFFALGSDSENPLVLVTNRSITLPQNATQVILPISPTSTESYEVLAPEVLVYIQESYPELEIDSLPSFEIVSGATETETETETDQQETESVCCGCGDTYITVNADGSLTLNNDISGDMPINIDNNADLSLNVNAAAGAFGAGAIVVDPDANVNLNAGAFAAGAFGAGAITGDINLSGDLTIDQSGSTITNNYYYDPSEPEQPFTIDYDEILSEDELESVLTQETYEIIDIETVSEIYLPETIPGDVSALPGEVVVTGNSIINTGSQIITDSGLMPVYAPLALFSVACYILRGLR